MTPTVSIIGIGEDGVDGLSAAACALIADARLVLGGARHLALADRLIAGARAVWPTPIGDAVGMILAAPGPVVALASGDPFWFGVGTMLARGLPAGSWRCLPQVSALSLACARLGWGVQDADVVSTCGRPVAAVAAALAPGRRLLVLSQDAQTPADVARLLCAQGFGPSEMVVMEALGGPRERISRHRADSFAAEGFAADAFDPLNLLAITPRAAAGARVLPRLAGLPDAAFAHDGQITKREIRAVTLAALAPMPGELLWDIGAGSGSIAIEWMRAHAANRAVAVDRRPDRLARAAANARELGVPGLDCVAGGAPEALAGLPAPDAVFVGGGAGIPGVVEACWAALRTGGRLVMNAVTIETEAVLFAARQTYGGSLTRMGVERLVEVGRMHGYRPAMTITQFVAVKT